MKRNRTRMLEYGNKRFEDFLNVMLEEVACRDAHELYRRCGYTTTVDSEDLQL